MLAGGVIVAVMLIAPGVDAQDSSQPDAAAGPIVVNNIGQTHQISYQGQLLNPNTGGPVADGTYPIRFRIYDAPTGGNVHADISQTVRVVRGIFSTLLDVNPEFFSGGQYWLGVQVSADPEASPRQPITYVPYAFWSRNADKLDGYGSEYLPVAFGIVDEDGDRISGPNFSSRLGTEDVYEIEIDGEDYNLNEFVTVVTPLNTNACDANPAIPQTNSSDDELNVWIVNRDGNTVRCKFHFVVYKP
jgi:hypothetical protein